MFRVAAASFAIACAVGWIASNSTVGVVAFFAAFLLIAVANVGKLRCPACRKRVKLGASRCHHCGQDVAPTAAR